MCISRLDNGLREKRRDYRIASEKQPRRSCTAQGRTPREIVRDRRKRTDYDLATDGARQSGRHNRTAHVRGVGPMKNAVHLPLPGF